MKQAAHSQALFGMKSLCSAGVISLLVCSMLLADAGERVPFMKDRGKVQSYIEKTNKVLLLTDGSQSLVQHSTTLATEGLGTGLSSLGKSARTYVVDVNEITPELLNQLQQIPGVKSVYPVYLMDGQPIGVTQDVVIKAAADTTTSQIQELADEFGLDLRTDGPDLPPGVYLLRIPSGANMDAMEKAATMTGDSRIAWVSADAIAQTITTQATGIQDPLFKYQWHLSANSYGKNDIDALGAWAITLGQGVIVGEHDSGVELTHPDLMPNFIGVSSSAVPGRSDASVYDPTNDKLWHGTAVMGLIAAAANSIGVRGVAPQAQWTATSGVEEAAPYSGIAACYTFAKDQNVSVHNNSWGFNVVGMHPDVIVEAIQDVTSNGRAGKGMVVLFAMGNGDPNTGIGLEVHSGDGFADLPYVIGVGAVAESDTIASYSNFGYVMDIMGPSGDFGIGLATTDMLGPLYGYDRDNIFIKDPDYTDQFSGTSGATPVVSGVAALMLAANPTLNRYQVRQILVHTTEQVSADEAQYSSTEGISKWYAYGRVNAANAVKAAKSAKQGSASVTYPGEPENITAKITPSGDTNLLNVTWRPGGMFPASSSSAMISDENQVLLVRKKSSTSQTGAPAGINWRPPQPGESLYKATYTTGSKPDPVDPDVVVMFDGTPQQGTDKQHHTIKNLVVDSDAKTAALFALYTRNSLSSPQYSYGVVFDQTGKIVSPSARDLDPKPHLGGSDPEATPPVLGRTEPPAVSATADTLTGVAPLDVVFHGDAKTPLALTEASWNFGDGTDPIVITPGDSDSSTPFALEHQYNTKGTYYAMFSATNAFGSSVQWLTVNVLDANPNPTPPPGEVKVTISVLTDTLEAGKPVRFLAETTGIGESDLPTKVTYDWDFGDGNVGTGQISENVYVSPGFYSMAVQVTELRDVNHDGNYTPFITISATKLIQIEGDASFNPGGEDVGEPISISDQNANQNTSGGGNGPCGAMGPAMIVFMMLGLIGMRRRLRGS